MERRCLVTGATGLMGSHLVEHLIEQGESVRALVRPTSDVSHLARLGVDLCQGDLDQPRTLLPALEGVDVVFHCASVVGDWGPWNRFFQGIPVSTVNLLKACEVVAVGRVVHVSSLAVHGHPKERADPFTESEPLLQHLWWWDHFVRAKALAEQRVQVYPGDWTIVRPGWTYGPRDRNTMPRIIQGLRARAIPVIGTGENHLNILYAEDVARGIYRAGIHPEAVGQVYNLASSGEITQRDLLNALTDELGLQRITRRVPYSLALWRGFIGEAWGRLWGWQKPPRLTRHGVALLGRSTHFSTEKARTQLGWTPRVSIQDGVRRTLSWFFEQEAKEATS